MTNQNETVEATVYVSGSNSITWGLEAPEATAELVTKIPWKRMYWVESYTDPAIGATLYRNPAPHDTAKLVEVVVEFYRESPYRYATGYLVVSDVMGSWDYSEEYDIWITNAGGGGGSLCYRVTGANTTEEVITRPPVYAHPTGTEIDELLDFIISADAIHAVGEIPIVNILIPSPILDPLCTSISATRKIIDKMASATISYEGITHLFGSSTYFKQILFTMPDYLGTQNPVFLGFFPSGQATVIVSGDIQYESFTAYDYAWYLTMQYLPFANQTYLTPDVQLLQKTYDLWYFPAAYKTIVVGDILLGATSGDYGIVSGDRYGGYDGGSYYRIVTVINPANTSGGEFGEYTSGENLTVGGVTYGVADGHAVDVTGVITVVTPEVFVTDLLGGMTGWQTLTGIYPYRMTPLPDGWSSSSDPVAIEFDFPSKTTKIQAIEKICKYAHYIFIVKPRTVAGVLTPCAYFIPETLIDDPAVGLDLPSAASPITFTSGNNFVLSPIEVDRKGEERYNRVTVKCQSLSGSEWFVSTLQTDGVSVGEEKPIEYFEINTEIATQAECDARCTDLFNYYSNHITTYTVTFLQRSDLQIMQRVYMVGYEEMPSDPTSDDLYRIVAIKYDYKEGGTVNDVVCTLIPDSQFKFYLNLNRVFTDTITEEQNVIKGELDKIGSNELAIAQTVAAGVVTGITEQGITKLSRDAT